MRPTGSRFLTPFCLLTVVPLLNGSGIDDVASATSMAQNAIVVTHNYRLNAFGFLAHPDLTTEDAVDNGNGSSGNQGLFDTLTSTMDYDNAEAIGGSPRNIMIS